MNNPSDQNLATQDKDAPKEFRLNYTSADEPTVNDDETLGFHIHSKWFVEGVEYYYVCTDASEGAAVWKQIFLDEIAYQVVGGFSSGVLAGRHSSGVGVLEQITVGRGLSLSGNTLLSLSEYLITTFEIDLNTTDTQAIYTVPEDLKFIPTKCVFREPSEDLSASTATLTILNGASGTVFTQAMNVFTATNKYLVKRIDTVQPIYAETETLSADLSAAKGSAGSIWVDVFGYLLPADILEANYLTEDDGDRLTDDSGNYLIEG